MFTQLIRVGRDAELRYTPNGKAVCGVACAYDIGYGDKKRTQWIEGVLWEKKAESLAPYLVKGQQAMVTFDDVELDIYESNGKSGANLKARIVDLKLCGGANAKPEQSIGQQNQGQQNNQGQQAQQQSKPAGMEDFEDVPFDHFLRCSEYVV
jgi:single-strand DNA-binding protein